MQLGAILGVMSDPANPAAIAEQARSFAGEGYGGLWTVQAVGRGQMMPDPLLTLAVAATATDDVALGTAILQVPLYHPVDLAHRVFSLKQLAGKRLIFGVGPGSTDRDFDAYDRDYAGRFRSFSVAMEQLRTIFDTGRLGNVDLTPWPALLGTPRLFLGSWGKGVERAAQEFDGWIASAMHRSVAEIEAAARRFRIAGGKHAVVSTIIVDRQTDLGELRDKLKRFEAAGLDQAVVMLIPGGPAPAEVRRLIE